MVVCGQCKGFGSLQSTGFIGQGIAPSYNNDIEVGRNSGTFTQSKQVPVQICPTCLGSGKNTGAGT